MNTVFVVVPYQGVNEGAGNGKGPLRLAPILRESARPGDPGYRFDQVKCTFANDGEPEAMIRINSIIARKVRSSVSKGALPLVLSGNCYTCLGVLGGLKREVGLIWIDAHGDFNTPEITPSGYLDGMGLAIATGRCHASIRQAIGVAPVAESNVLLVAARDLDPLERESLLNSKIQLLKVEHVERATELEILASRVREVYLHIDLDVLDPSEAPGVIFKARNGLTCAQLDGLIRSIARHFSIAAVNITGYNPDLDQEDKTLRAAVAVIETILNTRHETL